jgi:hypothetical protein
MSTPALALLQAAGVQARLSSHERALQYGCTCWTCSVCQLLQNSSTTQQDQHVQPYSTSSCRQQPSSDAEVDGLLGCGGRCSLLMWPWSGALLVVCPTQPSQHRVLTRQSDKQRVCTWWQLCRGMHGGGGLCSTCWVPGPQSSMLLSGEVGHCRCCSVAASACRRCSLLGPSEPCRQLGACCRSLVAAQAAMHLARGTSRRVLHAPPCTSCACSPASDFRIPAWAHRQLYSWCKSSHG